MTIQQLACPHCGGMFQVDSAMAGQQAGCPHCQGMVMIPAGPMPGAMQPGDYYAGAAGMPATPQPTYAPQQPGTYQPYTPAGAPTGPENVSLTCSLCGGLFQVTPSMAGQQVACPHCNGLITVPAVQAAAPTMPYGTPPMQAPVGGPTPGTHPGATQPAGPMPTTPPVSPTPTLPAASAGPAPTSPPGGPLPTTGPAATNAGTAATAKRAAATPAKAPGASPSTASPRKPAGGAPASPQKPAGGTSAPKGPAVPKPAALDRKSRQSAPAATPSSPTAEKPVDKGKPADKGVEQKRNVESMPATDTASAGPGATDGAEQKAVDGMLPPAATGPVAGGAATTKDVSDPGKVDSLLPPGVAAQPTPANRPLPVTTQQIQQDAAAASAPTRSSEVMGVPTEDGGFVKLHEPVKKVEYAGEEIELHRLTPEERARKRMFKNILMLVVGVIALVGTAAILMMIFNR